MLERTPNMPSWMKPKHPPRKETGRRYVNVKHKTGRAIVRYYIDERPLIWDLEGTGSIWFQRQQKSRKDDEFYTLWRLAAAFVVLLFLY